MIGLLVIFFSEAANWSLVYDVARGRIRHVEAKTQLARYKAAQPPSVTQLETFWIHFNEQYTPNLNTNSSELPHFKYFCKKILKPDILHQSITGNSRSTRGAKIFSTLDYWWKKFFSNHRHLFRVFLLLIKLGASNSILVCRTCWSTEFRARHSASETYYVPNRHTNFDWHNALRLDSTHENSTQFLLTSSHGQ